MPQESFHNPFFTSPSKRGLKGLVPINNNNKNNDNEASSKKAIAMVEESFNDHELAQRKAEEAASRRYQASEWVREMDEAAKAFLPKEPSEEEFRNALRNGLILCNVLNKVHPGAVYKVVENGGVAAVASAEGAAHSAIQYFENVRNFLEAVKDLQLLTFEASDLEKGGSSNKVVDCILCLKGYYEWKLSGGEGVWKYGGTVRITSLPKRPSPSSSLSSTIGSDDQSLLLLDEQEASQYEQLLEFLQLSQEFLIQESRTANTLSFLFDHFGLRLLQAYLRESDHIQDLPLNAMVIDTLLNKVVKDFSSLLASQGTQLGLFLKKILKGDDIGCLSKREFIEAISLYLNQRSSLASNDFSKFCICGGRRENTHHKNNNNNNNNSANNYSSKHIEVINNQQKQLEEMKYLFQETKMEVKQIQSEWEQESCRLEEHIKSLEVASFSYHKVLEENRNLYNQIQDLKGTIRVYCRVRPFLGGQSNGECTVDYIGENGDMMIVNPLKQGKDSRRVFSFNKVFGTTVTQEQIYADTQPLVRSVLDGYNVCIFAYGQTGSGKTYTMSGPDLTNEETWGVNYRALRDLFHITKERTNSIKYEVYVQMIEIYNEQVRDFCLTRFTLDIRNNSQLNGLNVPDAFIVPVTCTQDVLDLMRIGQRNRAVGATALNVRSSRSHSVLTVHVRGVELVSNSILRGCLHLVDLAGSERVDKSEAVGERLKEAQYINRSLSALGDVISALAQKSPHIPYRNSKLTQVLQDSLGGHAKTLMFVHINPEVNAIGETISTLKFAERVASISLGAAQTNKETGEIRQLKEEIASLKLALEKKETEVEQWKNGNNSRNAIEGQKGRAISPYRLPKYGNKPDSCQRPTPTDDKSFEVRSCSSGKQRRSRFPSALDSSPMSKMSLMNEEKMENFNSHKGRSPSPPVIRRSKSTERGSSVIKIKVKIDTADNNNNSNNNNNQNQPIIKHPFPSSRKVHQEINEEDQFKQALSVVRQGGIRKITKVVDGSNNNNYYYNKGKGKNNNSQLSPFKIHHQNQKHDMLVPSFGEIALESPRTSDYSDQSENSLGFTESIGDCAALNVTTKMLDNFPRSSQNLFASRGMVQGGEALLSGSRVENKVLNGSGSNTKESSKTPMPEFRRSRSTPRGKFLSLS
ncbi:Kinesin-like protein KIN-14F [Stylosanthes scabra]|uniref:Kinesin-like protein KIN-14F n=1 Tax=Stylosanthes scabra TaxID=79078 RepID=A0ABU6QCA4_9FABA|nr:Kinesin-like protein KIN-14F [Stylosanthes scabra]